MTINGRLLQDALDNRIDQILSEKETLDNKLSNLYSMRLIIHPYTFYECKEGHGVYGIRSPDPNVCKMCKRLEQK